MGTIALQLSEKWMPTYSGDDLAGKLDSLVSSAASMKNNIQSMKGKTASTQTIGKLSDTNTVALDNQIASNVPQNLSSIKNSNGGYIFTHNYNIGGGMSNSGGTPWGTIADGADQASQFAAKAIGNVYGSKSDPWKNNVRTIAYGNADDNILFSKNQRKYVNGFATDLRNKNLSTISQFNSSTGLISDLNKQSENFSSNVGDVGFGKKFLAANMASWQGAGKGGKWASQLSGGNPYATIAGWVVGGIGGAVRGIGRAIRGKRYLKQLNAAIEARNRYTAKSMTDSVNNFGVRQNNQLSSNWIGACGGQLPLANRVKSLHKYANGGKIEHTDSDEISQSENQFRTGVTEFNTGGSHEENPNGGIPQGIAPDGMPNLVEEGEVKVGDITGGNNQYILSNRIVIDKSTAEQFGIDKSYIGMTFAAAFRKAYKPLKESPNDPINRNELTDLINKFQQGQEFVKQQDAQMQQVINAQMANTPDAQQAAVDDAIQAGAAAGESMNTNSTPNATPIETNTQENISNLEIPTEPSTELNEQPIMARGGKMCHKFKFGGILKSHSFAKGGSPLDITTLTNDDKRILSEIHAQEQQDYNDFINEQDKVNKQRINNSKGFKRISEIVRARKMKNQSKQYKDDLDWQQQYERADDIEKRRMEAKKSYGRQLKSYTTAGGIMTKAPMFNAIRNLLDKNKYINPNKYDKYYEENKRLLHDDAQRVHYHETPKYVDPSYITSKIRSLGEAGARGLLNSYSGHGAAAAAALMSQNTNTQHRIGEQALQLLQYNNQLRQQHLQNRLHADMFNAQAQNAINAQNDQIRVAQNNELAQTHASADQINKQLRTAAFANAAKNIGQLGNYYDNKARAIVAMHNTPNGEYTDPEILSKYLNK